jgi:hypothetical protein
MNKPFKSKITSKKLLSMTASFGLCAIFTAPFNTAQAATFDLTGDYRFGTNMYQHLDTSGNSDNLNFWEHRFRLNPDVLIDQHFKFKSQVIFLGTTEGAIAETLPSQFGSALDGGLSVGSGEQALLLQNAYLEWSSDWGLLRVGRVPKAWGLGALYRQPDIFLSDFGSSSDRIDFKAMLGNLGLSIAFEKRNEGDLRRDSDDSDAYILSMDYSNPESGLASGILYERLVTGAAAPATFRNSSHDLSIFAKKTWGDFSLGSEFAMLSEENIDPRTGILFQANQEGTGLRYGLDFAYASSTGNSTFTFNPNYRPLLLLFRQSLGATSTLNVRGGSVGADVTGTGGGGVYLAKAHVAHQFKNSAFQLGGQIGWASLVNSASNGESGLGIETDLSLIQKWYDNFKVYYAAALLMPGNAWGSSPKAAWGVELKGVIEF